MSDAAPAARETAARALPGASSAARAAPVALLAVALDAALLALALGGLAALLRHTRALALLGVWAAGGVTLGLLRPVRSHAPTRTEPESKGLLAALFVLPLAIPPLGAWGERVGLFPWLAHPAIEWVGVAAAALGLTLRIAAMARLGSRFSPLVTVQQDHALETGGLYARVRHPGYLGALVACVGGMAAFGSALPLPLLIAFAVLLRRRIAREEALLERHFGDEYRRYRERTGALWPRLVAPRGG